MEVKNIQIVIIISITVFVACIAGIVYLQVKLWKLKRK